MNKAEIMNKVTGTVSRAGLHLKKHSPEILVGLGIAGGVASAVMACKATPKVNEIMEKTKKTIDDIHMVAENPEQFVTEEHPELYTPEEAKKDLAIVYAQTGLELAKTYGPAVVLGTLSITSILAGHNMLRKRYVATAAAYTILEKNFKDYRGRVIERFGKELDRELRYNIRTKEIVETVVDEKGKEKVVTTTVEEIDPEAIGPYARFYDEWCLGFEKNNPEYNLMTLRLQEQYANDRLQANKHLFLNEVYDMLGMQRTPIGQVVGWIYDPENPNIDSYVSFGNLFDPKNPDKRDFVNGREPAILLEFNCDGPIFEFI